MPHLLVLTIMSEQVSGVRLWWIKVVILYILLSSIIVKALVTTLAVLMDNQDFKRLRSKFGNFAKHLE